MRKLHLDRIHPENQNTQSLWTDNDVQLTEQTSTQEPRTHSDNIVAEDAARTSFDSRNELQPGNSVTSVASSTSSEEDYRSSTPKRKRDGANESAMSRNENAGDFGNTNRAKVSKTTRALSSELTASQEATLHFLRHYDDELQQPAMRLKFAKHLTYNVAEAEMYNVLDPATQLEFIRDFARLPANR